MTYRGQQNTGLGRFEGTENGAAFGLRESAVQSGCGKKLTEQFYIKEINMLIINSFFF